MATPNHNDSDINLLKWGIAETQIAATVTLSKSVDSSGSSLNMEPPKIKETNPQADASNHPNRRAANKSLSKKNKGIPEAKLTPMTAFSRRKELMEFLPLRSCEFKKSSEPDVWPSSNRLTKAKLIDPVVEVRSRWRSLFVQRQALRTIARLIKY